MPSMYLEAQAGRQLSPAPDALPLGFRSLVPAFGDSIAPGSRMNFNNRRAHRCGRFDLAVIRVDEQRYTHASICQASDDRNKGMVLAGDVQAAFRSHLFPSLGDEE